MTDHLPDSMMHNLFAVLGWRANFITHSHAALSTTLLNFKGHIMLVAELSGSAAAFPN